MKIAAILARKRSALECVEQATPLSVAVDLMHDKSIGSVGVIDRKTSTIVGIVSQHEMTAAIATRGSRALNVPVSEIMRHPALTCASEDTAETVMRTMTRERNRHAVVETQSGKVAGIVSLGDLVAALLEDARLEAGVLRDLARSHMLAVPA